MHWFQETAIIRQSLVTSQEQAQTIKQSNVNTQQALPCTCAG